MNIYYTTQKLDSLTSKGLMKFWVGYAVENDGKYGTQTESWQLKTDGSESKHIVSAFKESTIKNEGRANEVQPKEQAVLEIESAMLRKIDSGYVYEGEPIIQERPQAMLAHPWKKRKHNIKYPVAVQPKLNGVRMGFDGEVGWSRRNKDNIPETIQHMKCELPSNITLDGELMLDQYSYTFQESISATKKYRGLQLEYNVYDLVVIDDPDMGFEDRFKLLSDIVEEVGNSSIKLVSYDICNNEEEVKVKHDEYVGQGYEGLIARNLDGAYALGNRSADLLKLKSFFDSEYTVIGVEEGSGKDVGTAIFICEMEDGQTFSARPKGTHEQRTEYFENFENYRGKQLTVRYPDKTDDGKPQFPVGITFRDYE